MLLSDIDDLLLTSVSNQWITGRSGRDVSEKK